MSIFLEARAFATFLEDVVKRLGLRRRGEEEKTVPHVLEDARLHHDEEITEVMAVVGLRSELSGADTRLKSEAIT